MLSKVIRFPFLGILFSIILFFAQCQNAPATKPVVATPASSPDASNGLNGAKVVYVDLDSLQDHYAWFKESKTSFEQRERTLASSIDAKAQELQRSMAALQEKSQRGTVPPAQLQEEGQKLQRRQQELLAERDKKSKELVEESQQFNITLQKRIASVLTQLQQQKGYDYVMSYSKNGGGTLLFADNKLDITTEVLAQLNALPK